jgi:hypothetical protein
MEEYKQFFRQKYETSLVDFIKSDTSGNFEKILVKALEGNRSTVVEQDKIDSDVEELYKAGEGRWGTDENIFTEILTKRSFEHIQLIAQKYREKHHNKFIAGKKKFFDF